MRADIKMINENSSLIGSALYYYMYYLTPSSNIETNIQTVGQIYASALASGSAPSSTNITTLESIANKCPYTDGIGVYQARTLLAYYTDSFPVYNDESCSSRFGHKAIHKKNSTENDTIKNMSFNLYPNPNNGNFTLVYDLGKETTGKFEIYNEVGMEIGKYLLTSTNGTMPVSNPNLSQGIYFYKVYTGNQILKVGKIVIMK